jgi:hypothetical protein
MFAGGASVRAQLKQEGKCQLQGLNQDRSNPQNPHWAFALVANMPPPAIASANTITKTTSSFLYAFIMYLLETEQLLSICIHLFYAISPLNSAYKLDIEKLKTTEFPVNLHRGQYFQQV